MESIQIKVEHEGSLRRMTVSRQETLSKLKANIASLLGVTGDASQVVVKYRDEENDIVTIGSDQELLDVLQEHFAAKDVKILRLLVSLGAVEAKAQQAPQATQAPKVEKPAQQAPPQPQQPPQPREYAWSNLAEALSDPAVVQRVQQALQSPVITAAVARFAHGYTETRGDPMLAGLMTSVHLPALLGLFAELLEDLPVLKDLQQLVMQFFSQAQQQPPEATAVPGGSVPQKHFGVFCDGCGADEALKRVSVNNGHQTRRGFIRGIRYKSKTVHDFDLCESCKSNTERFPEDIYGPFDVVAAAATPSFGPGGCGRGPRGGWGGGWARAPHQQPWRCGGPQPGHHGPPHHGRHPHGPPHHGPHGHHGGPHHHGPHHHGPHPGHHEHGPHHHGPHHHGPHHGPHHHPHKPEEQEEGFDFVDAIRNAVARGTEAFVEASKQSGMHKDVEDIAKAIAESLKETAKEEEQDSKPDASADAPSSPVTHDEWVPVEQVASKEDPADPFVKWAKQLSQLEALGFPNLEQYVDFLEQEKGDLDRVVARIVSKEL